MAATPRAAAATDTNREHPVVTRHGLQSRHAETPPFRSMSRCMPVPKISASDPTICRSALPIHGSPGGKSPSPSLRRPQRDAGAIITTIRFNAKFP